MMIGIPKVGEYYLLRGNVVKIKKFQDSLDGDFLCFFEYQGPSKYIGAPVTGWASDLRELEKPVVKSWKDEDNVWVPEGVS